MKRAKPTGAGLLASTRGEAMYSYVAVVAVVGLVGLGGFQAFGGAMSTDIDGGSDGKGVAVSAAAAGAEVSPITPPAPGDTLPGVAGAAATIASGASTSTADGFASTTDALDARESEKGESCGWSPSCHFQRAAESIGEIPVLGPVHNFITNFGLNPVAWVADPIGQLKGAWNRLYGVGQFAWNTVYGLGKLLHEGNTLFNPLYPGYWYDVYQNGWDGHQQRGEDFLAGAWEDAQGVGDFLARANTLTIAYECATGGPSHCRDYVGDLASEAWQNPVTQSLVEPFGKCAGEVGSAEAQNACGQIAADIALTVATTGWGKGARGAHVAEEAASYADELAEAGSIASKSDDPSELPGPQPTPTTPQRTPMTWHTPTTCVRASSTMSREASVCPSRPLAILTMRWTSLASRRTRPVRWRMISSQRTWNEFVCLTSSGRRVLCSRKSTEADFVRVNARPSMWRRANWKAP
ncbi:MAG: hypothetical protein R3A78_12940 [Polyangiales bacterium]